MCYRRSDVVGATYFFTVNLLDRKQTLLTDHILLLGRCTRIVKERRLYVF